VTRREFRLPSSDEDYLNGLGLPWEAVRQGNQQWLLIHNWKVPAGYSAQVVILALLIDPNYPDTQLDSFYVFPGLQLIDAGPIKNTTGELQVGQSKFQFWSRHRSSTNPWRSGVDDIASHLTLVIEWFTRSLSD
jgi:hypothetical protein